MFNKILNLTPFSLLQHPALSLFLLKIQTSSAKSPPQSASCEQSLPHVPVFPPPFTATCWKLSQLQPPNTLTGEQQQDVPALTGRIGRW